MGVVAQEDDHFAACRSQCDKVLVFDRDSPAVRQINPEWLKGRRMARFPDLVNLHSRTHTSESAVPQDSNPHLPQKKKLSLPRQTWQMNPATRV